MIFSIFSWSSLSLSSGSNDYILSSHFNSFSAAHQHSVTQLRLWPLFWPIRRESKLIKMLINGTVKKSIIFGHHFSPKMGWNSENTMECNWIKSKKNSHRVGPPKYSFSFIFSLRYGSHHLPTTNSQWNTFHLINIHAITNLRFIKCTGPQAIETIYWYHQLTFCLFLTFFLA